MSSIELPVAIVPWIHIMQGDLSKIAAAVLVISAKGSDDPRVRDRQVWKRLRLGPFLACVTKTQRRIPVANMQNVIPVANPQKLLPVTNARNAVPVTNTQIVLPMPIRTRVPVTKRKSIPVTSTQQLIPMTCTLQLLAVSNTQM